MLRNLLVSMLSAALIQLAPAQALAWGQEGHRVVAHIAERHLTAAAKAKVKKITGGEPLARLATWPDEIRSDPHWKQTPPWHFLSIDDDESFDDFKRSADGDVLEALERFEKQLRDDSTSTEAKWQALAFYVHFVGDIHQPLHVGRREDLGGNKILVKWFGQDENLHALWDEGLIAARGLSYTEYAAFLDHASQSDISAWQSSPYLTWAQESKALRATVYDFNVEGRQQYLNVASLSYGYAYVNTPVMEKRLLQAGIRLAGMLNGILQ